MTDVMVVAGTRTAIGDYGGAFKEVPPTKLGAIAIREALARAKVDPASVGHVVMGSVIHGEARDMYLSRVAAVDAGIPVGTPALTVNRLCGSGLQAIVSAAQHIMLGDTMACRPEPHRRFTVSAGVPTGIPASTAATRERYMSRASPWITLPITTWPTLAGSAFALASASRMAIAPSLVGGTSLNAPP